jgi:hypothetical protein
MIRVAPFNFIVFAVLGLAASMLISASSRPVLPAISGNIFNIAAYMSCFDKQKIHVNARKPVTIRLTSLEIHITLMMRQTSVGRG